jgi:hypothetical protein
MSCAAINWIACWVCLGIGVGVGMFIASVFSGADRD